MLSVWPRDMAALNNWYFNIKLEQTMLSVWPRDMAALNNWYFNIKLEQIMLSVWPRDMAWPRQVPSRSKQQHMKSDFNFKL